MTKRANQTKDGIIIQMIKPKKKEKRKEWIHPIEMPHQHIHSSGRITLSGSPRPTSHSLFSYTNHKLIVIITTSLTFLNSQFSPFQISTGSKANQIQCPLVSSYIHPLANPAASKQTHTHSHSEKRKYMLYQLINARCIQRHAAACRCDQLKR